MVHWMAVNIISNKLLEDASRDGPDSAQGVNGWICIRGGGHSGGICGWCGGTALPEGHGTHVYETRMCALDIMLNLEGGFHLNQIYRGMEEHILGEAVPKGKYASQAVRS